MIINNDRSVVLNSSWRSRSKYIYSLHILWALCFCLVCSRETQSLKVYFFCIFYADMFKIYIFLPILIQNAFFLIIIYIKDKAANITLEGYGLCFTANFWYIVYFIFAHIYLYIYVCIYLYGILVFSDSMTILLRKICN